MADTDVDRFLRNLADAIAWFETRTPRNDPASVLRSAALRPLPAPAPVPSTRSWDNVDDFRDAAAVVLSTRRRLLETEIGAPSVPLHSVRRDSLVLYDPSSSLFDGAAMVASSGYFDEENTPPWDAWIQFIEDDGRHSRDWQPFRSYLVSWVPSQYHSLVAAGIAANPEQCIRWATDVETPFLALLMRRGVLT